MRNKSMFFLVMFFCLCPFFGQRQARAGVTLMDERLYIGGFYELLFGVHTEDPYKSINGVSVPESSRLWEDAGDLSLFRNTLQAEIEFKLTDHITGFSILRYFYDGLFDITGDINKLPESRLHTPDHGEDILRELYFDIAFEDWYLRIGKQQVVWGESDALRMADIINPLDTSWHDSTESWEDIREPIRLIDIHYTGFDWRDLDLEFLWIPEDFKPGVLAPEGAQWSSPGLTQDIIDGIYASQPTKHSIANSEIGCRGKARFGRFEATLFYFYTRSDYNVFKLTPFFQPVNRWPFYNVFGGAFNFYEERTETVFRGEFAFNKDVTFSPKDLVWFNFNTFQLEFGDFIERDVFSFMLAFDRPFWIKFLNEHKVFQVSGQLFNTHILDYHHNISSFTQSEDSSQTIVSLNIMTAYFHEYIQPTFLVVYDLSGTCWVKPEVKYVPSDYLNIALGANLFWSTSLRDSIWGPFRNNDEIYLRVRFPF